jgi:hypothetical protein
MSLTITAVFSVVPRFAAGAILPPPVTVETAENREPGDDGCKLKRHSLDKRP